MEIEVTVDPEQLAIEVADKLDGYEDAAKFIKVMDDYYGDYECTETIVMKLIEDQDDIDSVVRIINRLLDNCNSSKHIKYIYEECRFKLYKVADD